MEIVPVNDLDIALHNFVNKDDKMAFYSCLKYNLEETRVSIQKCLYLRYAYMTIYCTFMLEYPPLYYLISNAAASYYVFIC